MNVESRRHIPAFETTSLTNKFKSLWLAGIEAKLVFETRAGQAWGNLQVCLGEHPFQHQPTPHPQEHPRNHDSPAKQRRRERRKAARVEAAAIEAAASALAIAEEAAKSDATEAARATDIENANIDKAHAAVEEVADEEVPIADQAAAEEVSAEGSLFLTAVNDELCDDEQYYDVIDPGTAFTCLQCNIEHFPANYEEGDKVKKYVLCRWHLGVSKCSNCAKNLIGLGTIKVHRQICRAPS
jgi:hypothetical protein